MKINRSQIIILIITTLATGIIASSAMSIHTKTVAEYWDVTNLDTHLLRQTYTNKNCLASTKATLACLTGLKTLAISQGVDIKFSSPLLKPQWAQVSADSKKNIANEQRQWLASLNKSKIKNLNFETLLEQILQLKQIYPYTIASSYNAYLSVMFDPHTYIIPKDLYFDLWKSFPAQAKMESKILSINDKKFGFFKFKKFTRGICDSFADAYKSLSKDNIKGLVLDLRHNGGGLTDEATCLLNYFVESGSTLYNEYFNDGSLSPVIAQQNFNAPAELKKIPIVVFVDGQTASSAEIVAGVLREKRQAILLGEQTYGKGTLQSGRVWSYDKDIVLFKTVSYYVLPSGYSLQARGLMPDINISAQAKSVRENGLFLALSPLTNSAPEQKLQSSLQLAQCHPNISKNHLSPNEIYSQLSSEVLDCLASKEGIL